MLNNWKSINYCWLIKYWNNNKDLPISTSDTDIAFRLSHLLQNSSFGGRATENYLVPGPGLLISEAITGYVSYIIEFKVFKSTCDSLLVSSIEVIFCNRFSILKPISQKMVKCACQLSFGTFVPTCLDFPEVCKEVYHSLTANLINM